MKTHDLEKLKSLLKDSQDFRNNYYQDEEWQQLESYWYPDRTGGTLAIPQMTSDINRMIAQLFGGELRFVCNARIPEAVASARVATIVLNRNISASDLLGEAMRTARDTATLGTGILMDGFGSQYGTAFTTAGDGADMSMRRQKDNHRIEWNQLVKDNMPWTLRIHPSDFWVPPYVDRITDTPGAFYRYCRHKDEIADDEKYNPRIRKDVVGNMHVDNDAKNSKDAWGGSYAITSDYVVLYDWFDMRDNRRVTFTEESNQVLYDDTDELMIRLEQVPFHAIIFNDAPRGFWGTADFSFLEPIQMEINDTRTMAMEHRRVEVAKFIYDLRSLEGTEDQALFDDFVKKIKTDKVMAGIGINGNPSEFLKEFTPRMPWDFIPWVREMKTDMQEFIGMGPNQRGQMAGGRHTRYETALADSHNERSLRPRQRVIQRVLTEVATNQLKLMKEFWIEPQVVQTYDAYGKPTMVEFTGLDLEGDYDITLSLESLRQKTTEQKLQENNMILDRLAMLSAKKAPVQIDLANAMTQWFSKLDTDWDFASIISAQPPQPDPQSFDQYQQGMAAPGRPPQQPPQLPALLANRGA